MIAATDAKLYIFVDPYHTGRIFLIRGYNMGGGVNNLSICCNIFKTIHIYVISGMTEAYMTIACSLTRESTMVTDGIIMTLNLDIIGLCTESILIVMVEEDMVSLSAYPLLSSVLVRVTYRSSYFLLL